jgi:Fe-Mn family superoxide dismutase
MVFKLTELQYSYDALEPYIDARTMEIHYSKHHNGYTDKLNSTLEKYPDLEGKSITELLGDLNKVPEDIRRAVRNNGGGFYNHKFFWKGMSPDGGGKPDGGLAEAINSAFGDFAAFRDEFSKAAATHFGSGWAWLNKKADGNLMVNSTANQDSPISEGLVPLLCIDVWEHAYYLKYQNRRGDFITAWWNVVNWDEVTQRFEG